MKLSSSIRYYSKKVTSGQHKVTILKNWFNQWDKDASGTIDAAELKNMFETSGKSVSDEQVRDLMKSATKDANCMTFDDFAQLVDHLKWENFDENNLLNILIDSTKSNEVKDARIIFDHAWKKLFKNGRIAPRFPREIIYLGGAPGSGKGTNTKFIMQLREMHSNPIVISDLLNSPSAIKIKESGGLVGDSEVIGLLLEELVKQSLVESGSALIDGFPRTSVQSECVKLLYDEIVSLAKKNSGEKPIFRAVMLYVGEKESVTRQLQRGKDILVQNQQVLETGLGEIQVVRQTDIDITAARKRYKTFIDDTFKALNIMKQSFPFSFVNAQGTIPQVRENIIKELTYQSSLELNSETYDSLKILPTAQEIILNSRQSLVKRLEGYQEHHPTLFHNVIEYIGKEIIPTIKIHSLSGKASVVSYDKLFEHQPVAISILVDVLCDRGFTVVTEKHSTFIIFTITFPKPNSIQKE